MVITICFPQLSQDLLPHDAVYVGDIQGDYDASMDAGVKFIHAAYGFGTIEDKVPEIHKFCELENVADQVLQ